MTITPDAPRIFICPECLQGKHGNCDGTTLNEDTDLIVECECHHLRPDQEMRL